MCSCSGLQRWCNEDVMGLMALRPKPRDFNNTSGLTQGLLPVQANVSSNFLDNMSSQAAWKVLESPGNINHVALNVDFCYLCLQLEWCRTWRPGASLTTKWQSAVCSPRFTTPSSTVSATVRQSAPHRTRSDLHRFKAFSSSDESSR